SLLAEKHVRCGDAAVRNQLLRRLETVRRVDVPGLATVRTVRRQGDDVWVSTDLDDGLTLRRLLRVATLTPAQAVGVGRTVLVAIAALHRAGLCHGAVHAGNIHIGGEGRVRLSDAGLMPLVRRRAPVREARCRHGDVVDAVATIRSAMDSERQGRRELALSTRLGERLDAAIAGIDPRHPTPAPGARGPADVVLEALTTGSGALAGEESLAGARDQLAALVQSVRRPRQGFVTVPSVTGRAASAVVRPRAVSPPAGHRRPARSLTVPPRSCPAGALVTAARAGLIALAVIVLAVVVTVIAGRRHGAAEPGPAPARPSVSPLTASAPARSPLSGPARASTPPPAAVTPGRPTATPAAPAGRGPAVAPPATSPTVRR
ncbi:MAG: hypothetical protein ABR564_00355, partial [Candidatus Dormibacteria bacterium]